jgi:glycosyltransferase involved in cell wall biosynthesis
MEERKEILEGVSVVILTRNRVEYVQCLFISLYSELRISNEPAEVIVIDNSKSKDSRLISEMCKKYRYKFNSFKGSISEKRNYGIKVAKFPIVLFIDSDCEVVPGILREHIVSYTEENIGGVLGLTNFTGKKNWVWKAIEKTSFHIAFSFAKRMDYALWGPCTNISFRKDVVEKVGEFRTEFPFDFSGEDVDIGLRINELGYKIKCNPHAIVNHSRETWSNFWGFCRKIFRWGRTDFHILKMHPHLSCIEFPKFSTILLLLFILSIIFNLIGFGWKMAELLIIWLLCVPIVEAFLRNYENKKKITNFLFDYLSLWLIYIFELGAIFESLKKGSLLMLYKKILYGQGQLVYEWDQRILQSWSYILTFIIFLFVIMLG